MNWIGIVSILATGTIIYWRYLNRVSRDARSYLIDDLAGVIKSVPNKTVIHACNRYRKFLIQYEREIEDIISGVDNLINSAHTESVDLWKQECTDNLKTHLSLLKKYSEDLEETEVELFEVLNDQTFVKLINVNSEGLAEDITKELQTVIWKELIKGDIFATFILKFLTITEDKVRQLFTETKDNLLLLVNDIEIEEMIKILETNLEYLEDLENINNHLIFWKGKLSEHLVKLRIKVVNNNAEITYI